MIFYNQKINKYEYGWKLYVNYGQGWEYETMELTWKGYRENAKAYRENCSYPQRWSYGRDISQDWLLANQLLMVMEPVNPLEYE